MLAFEETSEARNNQLPGHSALVIAPLAATHPSLPPASLLRLLLLPEFLSELNKQPDYTSTPFFFLDFASPFRSFVFVTSITDPISSVVFAQ